MYYWDFPCDPRADKSVRVVSAIPQRAAGVLVCLFRITKVEHGASLLHWIVGVSSSGARPLGYPHNSTGVRPVRILALRPVAGRISSSLHSTPLRVLAAPQFNWR